MKEQLSNCTLIGDKGYLSAEVQIDLFNYANIQLDTPKKTIDLNLSSLEKTKTNRYFIFPTV